ncbi:MAG: NAD-dependent epimerase/dehydratase family protein, partial [Kiritimatiellae bacterium]|nr:NAD-dependent epimerase/dehydratase family protein [Kiritimatiellia bacterium]
MKCLVTGAAGFIGSNLTDRLLREGHSVLALDNFSTGFRDTIQSALNHPAFDLREVDLLEPGDWSDAMAGVDAVFHLAANADVRFGLNHPRRDLEQNTLATFNVLEAMREHGVRRIAFSSTGSIYGEPTIFPTPENAPFPIQTSLYGASKLACEGLIQAYCEGYGFQGTIYRFVSILGERYSHGHVFDFYRALKQDPTVLRVLGNGKQRKSYLYVQDCVEAILKGLRDQPGISIYNLGTDEYVEVNDSIRVICEFMGLTPHLDYAGGERGWVGDSPFIFLDCAHIRSTGWKPRLSIREAVVMTLEFFESNPW